MAPKLTDAQHLGEFRVELKFADGLMSVVDFRARVINRGGVWLPLHDVEYFKQFRIDPELETIVWPNGVDICPDLLYELATGKRDWRVDAQQSTTAKI